MLRTSAVAKGSRCRSGFQMGGIWPSALMRCNLVGLVSTLRVRINPHWLKIFSGPSSELQQAWDSGAHQVLFHPSTRFWNTDEHNFVKGFRCAIGMEKHIADYPKRGVNCSNPKCWIWWTYINNPKVVTGEAMCLDQLPQ